MVIRVIIRSSSIYQDGCLEKSREFESDQRKVWEIYSCLNTVCNVTDIK